MWSFARSSARAHRSSMLGSFFIVALASALLSATGVLLESGIRTGSDAAELGAGATLLASLAASFAGTTIVLVLFMVSTTISAALRQRRREFALLRAVGATGRQVRSMVTSEVLLVFAVAGPLGAIPGIFAARLVEPALESSGILAPGADLYLSPLPALATLLLLVPTGVLAARLAGREAVRTSPTAAVQESNAEPSTLGRGRRITAAALAAGGLGLAVIPFIAPSMMGVAAGTMSAFLLIAAAGVAGPLVVAWAAERALRVAHPTGSASTHLAMLNARGFSRRLTSAIVPLALLLALGTVQSAIAKTSVEAAEKQLEEGLHADLVVDATQATPEQVDEITQLPGVAAATGTALASAEVKTEADDEDMAMLDGLSWEATGLRVLPSGTTTDVFDPKVTSGSIADLDGVDTIAVGGDATFGTGKGLGDTIELRFGVGEEPVVATIVAIYDRGLGFGPFIVSEATTEAHDVEALSDAVYIKADPGATADVRSEIEAMGLDAQSKTAFIASSTTSGAGEQDLSTILLMSLLVFVALAAANTLAMLTAQRGGEFSLLRRTGATGGQLTAMVAVESVFVVLAAWAIGTVAVLPALLGASFGLLGSPLPVVDWASFGGLAGAVAVIGILAIIPVALRQGAGAGSASTARA